MNTFIRKLLALAADGMAGFEDLAVGAGIVLVMALVHGTGMSPWWHLFIGSFIAFSPDLDLLLRLKGQRFTGDHRDTFMHWPLPMLVGSAWIAGAIGSFWDQGMYWAEVTFLCLLWHYVHDTKWLNPASDINWFAPFVNKEMPYMNHHEWRERYWLQPSNMSGREIIVGTLITTFLTAAYVDGAIAVFVMVALFMGTIAVWGLSPYYYPSLYFRR